VEPGKYRHGVTLFDQSKLEANQETSAVGTAFFNTNQSVKWAHDASNLWQAAKYQSKQFQQDIRTFRKGLTGQFQRLPKGKLSIIQKTINPEYLYNRSAALSFRESSQSSCGLWRAIGT
jgi:hypothetical protein